VSTHSVLLLSVGPVQDLIASARRCRDLWFGSWLLADASRVAADHVAQAAAQHGGDGSEALVFPGAASRAALERDRRVANRILARLPVDVDEASDVARGAADAARDRLQDLARRAFDRVPQTLAHYLHRDAAEAQVADLLDIQWVVVAEAEGGYDRARRRADQLLAARKQTRVWDPPTWSGPVPKSSIDGFRESVIDETLYDAIAAGDVAARDAYDAFRVHPSERLCGVGLLKRLGRDSERSGADRFFSTSHLAALPTLAGAARHPDAPAAFERLRDALDDTLPEVVQAVFDVVPRKLPPFGRMDGAVLFEGRLAELAEELQGERAELSAKIPKARQAVRCFRAELGLDEPLPYFAVLLADGDRMGRAIRHLKEHDAHRRLSQALSAFAEEALAIVESDAHLGSLVYSGGDDVLALLPLHSALGCAEALRDAFEEQLRPLGLGTETPTLSVGVAIGHHLSPLDATLDQAREAERLAKQTRNSFALVIDKRSGPELALAGTWDEEMPLTERLRRFTEAHLAGEVSDKAAFELMALEELVEPHAHHPGLDKVKRLDEVVAAETERVLRGKKLDEDFLAELHGLGLTAKPHELGRELVVARLFAEARRRANAPTEEPSR